MGSGSVWVYDTWVVTKLPFPFFACLSTKAVSDPNHLFVWVRENVRDKSKFNPSFLQLLSWALGGVKAESRERGPWVKFRFRKDRLLEAFLYLACPRSMPAGHTSAEYLLAKQGASKTQSFRIGAMFLSPTNGASRNQM